MHMLRCFDHAEKNSHKNGTVDLSESLQNRVETTLKKTIPSKIIKDIYSSSLIRQ